MWFLVISAFSGNVERVSLEAPMSVPRYATHAQCMADAKIRLAAFASLDIHGRYLCMYQSEPDAKLASTQKGEY